MVSVGHREAVVRRSLGWLLAAPLALWMLLVGPANAAGPELGGSRMVLPSISGDTAAQIFSPWGDNRYYTPLLGGDAESSRGWDLAGGAAINLGNEPWQVWGVSDRSSVRLTSGSRASLTSPVSLAEDVRFFVQRPSDPGARLQVSIRVLSLIGTAQTAVSYLEAGSPGWGASDSYPVPDLLGAFGSQLITVSVVNVGSGTWRVDDVSMDPWRAD